MDPADRLGVPPDADAATVRAAFSRQVRAVHPDTAGAQAADAAEVGALVAARDIVLARLQGDAPVDEPAHVVFYQRRSLVGRAGHRWAQLRRRATSRVLH